MKTTIFEMKKRHRKKKTFKKDPPTILYLAKVYFKN